MSHKNLLRKPVELWSTLVSFSVGSVFLKFSLPVSCALYLFGISRAYQGYRILRYQHHLRHLPTYRLSSEAFPQKTNGLFLGKGFRWQPLHTQRLYDLGLSENMKYLPKAIEKSGNPCIHGVSLTEQDVFMPLTDRVGHMMILGTTRVGKTRLLECLIASDIHRNDSPVIVFDPKGDSELLRRIVFEAEKAGRSSDVIIFHLGYPNHSARYNPIGQFARITEVANRVANQLPSSGESAAFREFAWRFVNIIAGALVALGKRPNYRDLDHYILSIDPLLKEYCQGLLPTINPHWEQVVNAAADAIDEKKLPHHLKSRDKWMIALTRYVDSLDLNDPTYAGLKAIFNYDQTYFQKITASLSPLFAKLTTGKIAELISPDYFDLEDERPIFDWQQVIRGKKIVYIGLDALSDGTVSTAVGNSMFADLCSTIGQIYKYGVQTDITNPSAPKNFHPINVYGDEFNELAGEEFIPLANKGGGAGLQLTVATQTDADVEVRFGKRAKATQIIGNMNNLVFLRVLDEATARLLTDKLPKHVDIETISRSSSSRDHPSLRDGEHFSSHNDDRINTKQVPLIANEHLMQLPQGHAFALLQGGRLWKIRIPLPGDELSPIPDSAPDIVDYLRQ